MTPPTMAAMRAACHVAAGPNQAPIAANNFTSPAPIRPMGQNAMKRPNPSKHPRRLADSAPARGRVVSENAKPAISSASTPEFGMRRCLMSTTADDQKQERKDRAPEHSRGCRWKHELILEIPVAASGT